MLFNTLKRREDSVGHLAHGGRYGKGSLYVYWTFAITAALAFSVNVHVRLFSPPVEHAPDRITPVRHTESDRRKPRLRMSEP
jgi:hypothetical protein